MPTPEAGALLSGLITLHTPTRGIYVPVYTLRREKERERKSEIEKRRERERHREGGGQTSVQTEKGGRRGATRATAGGNLRLRVHGDAHVHRGTPYQHAKLDFMCDRLVASPGIRTQIAIGLLPCEPTTRSLVMDARKELPVH